MSFFKFFNILFLFADQEKKKKKKLQAYSGNHVRKGYKFHFVAFFHFLEFNGAKEGEERKVSTLNDVKLANWFLGIDLMICLRHLIWNVLFDLLC